MKQKRFLAVLVIFSSLLGCVQPKPPIVIPTPAPTPTPGPTPTPTPTPKPPEANSCLPAPALSLIECKNVGQLRVVIDCTSKTCANQPGGDMAWNKRCSTGLICAPGGQENDPAQRKQVETAWGPYTWSILNPNTGVFEECLSTGACFLDGGNPLRAVVPAPFGGTSVGKTVRIQSGPIFTDTVGQTAQ